MHETSALWKQIFAEPDHRKEVKVTINGAEYNPEDDRLIRASISGSLFDAPSVGGAVSRTLELELVPWDGGGFPPMSEIRLFVRLVSADGQRVSEYIPKGVFYSDAVKRDYDTGAVTVTAFDAIMKMERMFSDAVCRVVFDDGYGKIQRFVREIGDPMPAPNAPTHAGLRFVAWRPNPSATAAVVRDMRFIAQWEEAGVIASGDWWTLFDNGLLDIYCEGDMPIESGVRGPWSYDYAEQIVRVTIRHGVTNIGDGNIIGGYIPVFLGCINLTDVQIPDSVASIGGFAFSRCNALESVTIPGGVKRIGNDAFRSCASLSSVTIQNGVNSIGNDAFSYCVNLASVTLPDSVTSIGSWAFNNCHNLKSVKLSGAMTNIPENAFTRCYALEAIIIPVSVINIEESAFSIYEENLHVYYAGTEEQWNAISIGNDNQSILSATKHYNNSGPT